MSRDKPDQHPGDDGSSELIGGGRRPKHAPVFECLGKLDEFNAALGHLRAELRRTPLNSALPLSVENPADALGILDADIRSIQQKLGQIMAACAAAESDLDPHAEDYSVTDGDVTMIETLEKNLRSRTEIQPVFVIPGETNVAAALADVARTQCRSCERSVAAYLASIADVPGADHNGDLKIGLRYVNRLSDYLFVVARHLEEDKS